MRCHRDQLAKAKPRTAAARELHSVAKHFLLQCATCITFNYDDFLDQALFEECGIPIAGSGDPSYWTPFDGYGFECQYVGMPDAGRIEDPTSYLLKLHGSINWRVKLGSMPPYRLEDVVHDSPWCSWGCTSADKEKERINRIVEPEPFIVPPVLAKSELLKEPVLRLVWREAFKALRSAGKVVFVGYSLPVTDLASRFLFSEAIQKDCEIEVVNYAHEGDQGSKTGTIEAYKQVFPSIGEDQFNFRGAKESEFWTSF